jgi:hypothetical protein
MNWERQKATIAAEPDEPSLVIWLIAGLVAVIAGVLLFVLTPISFLNCKNLTSGLLPEALFLSGS